VLREDLINWAGRGANPDCKIENPDIQNKRHIIFQRNLIYVKSDQGIAPHESWLVLDADKGLVVTSKPLIAQIGKTYCVSIDGTKNNLQEITDWQVQPTNGPDVGPFLYYVRKGQKISN